MNKITSNGDSGISARIAAFVFLGAIIICFTGSFFVNSGALFESSSIFAKSGTDMLLGFGNSGFVAYAAAFLFWMIFLSVAGFPWALVFLSKSDTVERVIFSITFGLFVMGANMFIASGIAALYSLHAGDAAYAEYVTDKIGDLLAGGQEQSYAVFNVLIWFVVGIMALIAKEIVVTARKK